VPSIPISALPVDQFEAFVLFAQTAVATQRWPMTFEKAAQLAASVLYALGQPSVVPDKERDALRRWCAFYNTEAWRVASIRACNIPRRPVEDSASFSLDDPCWHFDRGAWAPADPHAVIELNAWCEQTLGDFYAAERSDDPSTSEGTVASEPEDVAAANPEPARETAEAMPATSQDKPPLASKADAIAAHRAWTEEGRANGQAPTWPQDKEWRDKQACKPTFRFTDKILIDCRSANRTEKEKMRGRRRNQE
jgi:hypothetical protein